MAYFSRLIFIFLLLPLFAQAEETVYTYNGKEYIADVDNFRTNNDDRTDAPTAAASCQAYGPLQEASCQSMSLPISSSCKATCTSGWTAYYPVARKCVLPAIELPSSVAPAGCYVEKPLCPTAGTKEGDSSNAYTTNSKQPANDLCIGNCSWSAGGVVPSVCANGKCYYYGPFTSNGRTCSGDAGGGGEPPAGGDGGGEASPAPDEDAQCVAKGQCPGTVNGMKLCVPCSNKEGTTSESGSTSGSGTDASGNPTGETGTTNTTKETTANCTNGSCNTTTTTTVTNPDGSTTTTTETESKPQADFCKANPGHVVCKGEQEGTFGGSCSSGFQCSGDAVQCAQAEAAWKSACASDVSGMTEQINTGTVAMAAGAASGLGIPGGSEAFDLGSRLSEVPLFGGSGGCPSDVSVNVGGTSYTIAFSAMCPQLQVLGVALMAFAYLIAGFIVFRGDRS